MSVREGFNYETAFDRNLGWTTEAEQQTLRHKRVAIAGLGGVGGAHLLALTRTGIGAFSIADLDRFDLANTNRQVGAMVSTYGRPKVEVLAEMARDINPELRLTCFPNGIDAENIDSFLDGAALFVDGFDFFALDIRRRVFARCMERDIPAITAAPIGMGTGYLVFRPGGMSFETYFGLAGQSEQEQYLRFLMGVAPRGLARAYLVDPERVDLARRRGPSTAAACNLCAGVVAAEAIKILLRRGPVRAAPFHQHFDAYRGKLVVSWLPFGAAGPFQTLKRIVARRIYSAAASRAQAARPPPPADPIEAILSLARWTPSGDNAQPWRFHRAGSGTVFVDIAINPTNVYEYRGGEPTLLSAGMLLESLRIAATAWGRRVVWSHAASAAGARITVRFEHDPSVQPDSLVAFLTSRSVDRGGYRWRPLTAAEKRSLAAAIGPGLEITWHETLSERLRVARLAATATNLRLRIPETFPIHNAVIDWAKGSSRGGIPASALGLPGPTMALMRWAARDWRRMDLLNRLGGAATAMLQMDIVPGIRAAAFFSVRLAKAGTAHTVETILEAGERLQRLWLTADQLGLVMHPGLATLAFAHHGGQRATFTEDPGMRLKAARLARDVQALLGPIEDLIFIARVGEPITKRVRPRSIRRHLHELMISDPPDTGKTE